MNVLRPRFWRRRGETVHLNTLGFLEDPEGPFGAAYQPNAKRFEELAELGCLALLGEPGVGKSTSLREAYASTQDRLRGSGGRCFLHDLNEYQNESRLLGEIFRSAELKGVIGAGERAFIFLDSLDECILRLEVVANVIGKAIQALPPGNVFLRIACRTAVWPESLENSLRGRWGDQFAAYELLPLRQRDAETAAVDAGVDPNAFLKELADKGIGSLAIKPLTLSFLLHSFLVQGELSASAADVMRDGCRLLAGERNNSRLETGRTGDTSTDQRLAVAARIAALSQICGKPTIWIGTDELSRGSEDLVIREVVGGQEESSGSVLEVNEAAIKETLDTGLFSARGRHSLGFVHQGYAEFLAAEYLHRHQLGLAQVSSLLLAADGSVIPQLVDVAAWLAVLNRDVFDSLVDRNPDVLVRADLSTFDNEGKRTVIDALLRSMDTQQLSDDDVWARFYGGLHHPGLASQVLRYIEDPKKNHVVRRVAIQIASDCRAIETLEGLLRVALDREEDSYIRARCVAGAREIGQTVDLEPLVPLTQTTPEEDQDDQIRGHALKAVWPDLISTADVLGRITSPQRPSFIGAYYLFLTQVLPQRLPTRDLPVALRWITEQEVPFDLLSPLEEATQKILLSAWNTLDSPEVLQAFAAALLARSRQLFSISGERYRSTSEQLLPRLGAIQRHTLVEKIVAQAESRGDTVALLLDPTLTLLESEDTGWLIGKVKDAIEDSEFERWAAVLRQFFPPPEADLCDEFLRLSETSINVRQTFADFIEPVELDSEAASVLRERHRAIRQPATALGSQPRPKPPTRQIEDLLEQFDSGDLSAFCRIHYVLMRSSHQPVPVLAFQNEHEDFGQELRSRVITSAKQYIRDFTPSPQDWTGTPSTNMAGYWAFHLVLHHDPGHLDSLSGEIWKRWAPVLVGCNFRKEEDQRKSLLRRASEHASKEIRDTVLTLVQSEAAETDSSLRCLDHVRAIEDESLVAALQAMLENWNFGPDATTRLLGFQLERYADIALEAARNYLRQPTTDENRARKVAVVAELLRRGKWSDVRPELDDEEIGKEVLLRVKYRRGDSWVGLLGASDLTELYVWLVGHFPFDTDPTYEGAHTVTDRDSVTHLRNSILGHLRDSGTPEAVAAVERISEAFPEINWMPWIVVEARQAHREHTWRPPQPQEVLQLAESSSARLVHTGDDLQAVVLEALGRLQCRLHGETPQVRFLWDEVQAGQWKPKNEESLSDFVKDHLDRELVKSGVVVNREVQIRRSTGEAPGERNDIHIDAIAEGPRGEAARIKLIIEVKGCWNNNLERAMETQLKDRYLRNNDCQHGLYLVGWYLCDAWMDEYRRTRSKARKLEVVRSVLKDQAKSLSGSTATLTSFVLDARLSDRESTQH